MTIRDIVERLDTLCENWEADADLMRAEGAEDAALREEDRIAELETVRDDLRRLVDGRPV